MILINDEQWRGERQRSADASLRVMYCLISPPRVTKSFIEMNSRMKIQRGWMHKGSGQ